VKYLLDTVVFLWAAFGEESQLSRRALKIIEESSELHFSAVSAWEIAIKYSIGKLHLKKDPRLWLPDIVLKMGLKQLPVTQRHALRIIHLPHHHKDPFDRLLVGQALTEELSLLTPDAVIKKYRVRTVW
jgi:PIN domain nuclease of toxin-antitoxin system